MEEVENKVEVRRGLEEKNEKPEEERKEKRKAREGKV